MNRRRKAKDSVSNRNRKPEKQKQNAIQTSESQNRSQWFLPGSNVNKSAAGTPSVSEATVETCKRAPTRVQCSCATAAAPTKASCESCENGFGVIIVEPRKVAVEPPTNAGPERDIAFEDEDGAGEGAGAADTCKGYY